MYPSGQSLSLDFSFYVYLGLVNVTLITIEILLIRLCHSIHWELEQRGESQNMTHKGLFTQSANGFAVFQGFFGHIKFVFFLC